jgi:hypothetical protein
MAAKEHLHDYPPSPTTTSRASQTLWTLTKDGVRVTAELFALSTAGVELRMLKDGDVTSRRRFAERAHARAHAEGHRAQMVATGWRLI